MIVERDGNIIESNGETITVQLAQSAEITERQLDSYLQYILIDLGVDVKYLDPKTEDPTPEVPAPIEAENVVPTTVGAAVEPQSV